MTTKELKLSWNGLTWTHSGEEDIGIVDAHFMKTITSLLRSLKMGGYTATQVALDNTSIKSLTLEYGTQVNPYQIECLENYVTSQTSGSTSNQSETMSKECQLQSSESLVGENGQTTTSGYLVDTSFLTSTPTGARLDTTRLDTLQEEIDALRSRVDALQSAMDSNAYQNVESTWRLLRGAETQSFYECVEYLRSVYQAPQVENYWGEWRSFADNSGSYLSV